MNTPTPETDVEAANFSDIDINDGDAAVSASFARKLERERDEARVALAKINNIRNSIIAHQSCNFSEHVYPLVAALNEAGISGMSYPDALAYYGPVTKRCAEAEAERDQLRKVCDELAEKNQKILTLPGISRIELCAAYDNYKSLPHVAAKRGNEV